jgi:NDP-sugar pyrophosphorylase family protein
VRQRRRRDPDVRLLDSARVARAEGVRATKTVILAGGTGTRLKPYTSVLPKPLMPLGDRAILEVVIQQLARQGFVNITLSVGHLAHVIEAVFGDGSDHAVELTYVREDGPLGTAGSLRLVPGLDDTFLMLNGDLVTTFDYREFVTAHLASGNLLTIATKKRRVDLDYGVLTIEHGNGRAARIVRFTEKPTLDVTVSMGIYVLEPAVLSFIPADGYFDFPDLVQNLLQANAPVGAFEYDGFWLDIGRQEDYDQAITLLEEGKLALLDGAFDPSAAATPARYDREPGLGRPASNLAN